MAAIAGRYFQFSLISSSLAFTNPVCLDLNQILKKTVCRYSRQTETKRVSDWAVGGKQGIDSCHGGGIVREIEK